MPIIQFAPALLALLVAGATAAHPGPKAVIFPFELIDVSLEGEYSDRRTEEINRLQLATDELRTLAARVAGYEVLDLSGLASDIESAGPFHKCDACELDIARKAGAEIAVTGTVRKISSLLLVVHIYVRDVPSGRVNKAHRVELRGNTDETWLRGVRRLVSSHIGSG
jgi:uncharacterized protein DUF2380